MTRPLPSRVPAILFLAAAALATAALWVVSRGKWGHAIVDSGREWIVPECLARGELLYRDVVYWFGPLTPYLHALLFKIFGSTFQTLVLAGVLASIAVLAALFIALRRVTGREEAALGTALAVPLLVFMPAAGGAIFGMGYRIWHAAALTLLSVAITVRPFRWTRAVSAGCLSALALLCRTEWGLAAMAGVAVTAAVRDRFRPSFLRNVLLSGLAFLLVGGVPLAAFVSIAGPQAVLDDGHLLLTGLPQETRRFLLNMSGFHDPLGGFLRILFSTALWGGVFLAIEVASAFPGDRGRLLRRRLPWLGGIAVLLVAYKDYSGWPRFALMSAAPAIGLAAVVFGLRRKGGGRAAAFVGFGSLAVVLSYRKLFSISDSPYVAPPLLFALVSGIGILRESVLAQADRDTRFRLKRWHAIALACLALVSFLDRLAIYAEDSRVKVPGTGGMLSARAETVETLTLLSQEIQRRTTPGDGLVVFPEGEVLNAISKRRNPLRYKLYIPGYLTRNNEAAVLAELVRQEPAAVVILNRATPEYGRHFFGVDYAKDVAAWIRSDYVLFPFDHRRDVPPESGARLFLRKP